MTIFGRNQPDVTTAPPRFTLVADHRGDLAVYDATTGRYAPFYGDTARFVAADLNKGTEPTNKYEWITEDSL